MATFEEELEETRVKAAKEGLSLRDYVQREHKKKMKDIFNASGGFDGFMSRNFGRIDGQ